MKLATVTKIVSGGQTGADRAGLDFAIKHSIPHGGWCPKYRKAEDGTVPMKYQLQEADKPGYPYRTRLNVQDSDGTVIFTSDPPGAGSNLTIGLCAQLHKPHLVITLQDRVTEAALRFIAWLREHRIQTLNVAGSRNTNYYAYAHSLLTDAYYILAEDQGESPKKFLRSVKVGIGESVREGKWQRIEFEDAQRRPCRVVCSGTEEVMLELVTPALEDVRLSISLTPGQAQRLANTLESWAFNGKLGGA